MGPLASEETALFKRNSTDAGFDAPLPIKQRRTVHHQIRWKQSLPDDYIGVCQNDEVIRAHLLRSIALALEAVGFQGADPRALEDFRVEVEDCTHSQLTVYYFSTLLTKTRYCSLPCQCATVNAVWPAKAGYCARFPLGTSSTPTHLTLVTSAP